MFNLEHRYAAVQRVVGLLLALFSFTMLPPVVVDLIYGGGTPMAYLTGFAVTMASGLAIWFPVRRYRRELKLRDGFLVVVLFWAVLGLFGAIPMYLAAAPRLSISQAVFEAISGLTTTGATVLVGLDLLPKGLLYYRQQLQWLGGMGIIVLAVAILPLLGVGGMQLYRAETPGPVKDTKLTPRIKETARTLWIIYVGITVACAGAYMLAGMSFFDALAHAFSTVANGGFSTYDASIGHFRSSAVELICVVFMLIAATNFALHFAAFRQRAPGSYIRDPEFRAFISILAVVTLAVTTILWASGTYGDAFTAFLRALFQTVSIGTTAGFTTADYTLWPALLPPILILVSFIGGCAYSTGGGIKVVRIMLLFKQGIREVVRMIHPSAELPIKLGHRTVPDRVIQAVWGYFSVYMGFYMILFVLMLASGLDMVSAFAAVAATINNLGPGLGEVAGNFSSVNAFGLWVGVFAMLLGRLELFPLLVLLTPYFWRR
jgi:trk system potassium uptake protein TrkH